MQETIERLINKKIRLVDGRTVTRHIYFDEDGPYIRLRKNRYMVREAAGAWTGYHYVEMTDEEYRQKLLNS